MEDRLSALEREVAELRTRVAGTPAPGNANWLAAVVGSMKDYPEFDEVARLGRAARQSDRPPDDGPG